MLILRPDMRSFLSYISGLLLLLLLFQLNGGLLVHELYRKVWRENISKVIEQEEDNLTTITLSLDNYSHIRWEKVEHEFWHQGKLYDVVSIEKGKNHIIITAFEDTSELHIVQKYLHHLKKIHQTPTEKTTTFPFFLPAYLASAFTWQHFLYLPHQEKTVICNEQSRLLCNILPPTPPPKRA